jgi:O-antigen/teichoic acid export membrane protein
LALLLRNDSSLVPHFRFASREIAGECISTGAIFLGLQICAALAYQTDVLIVSHLVGLPAAAELGLVNRMFLVATSITGFFIAPLWPAFRDAAVRGEIEWVKKKFLKTLRYSMLISLAITLPLLVAYKPITEVWIGRNIVPSFVLVLAVFLWTNILVVGSLITSMLNGLNMMRVQLIVGIAMVVMNLPISIILTQHIGPSGVVFGSIIAYSLFVLVPFGILLPGRLQHAISRA